MPTDNSFATCIETGEYAKPAGNFLGGKPILLKVTRQPFYKLETFLDRKLLLKFIEGVDESTGLMYRVLYSSFN